MHYYTQLLSVILICFLSLSSPHTCSSPCGLFCSLSLFPLQSLLCKNEKDEKSFSWKLLFCLPPKLSACCPHILLFCPKGKNKSLWWKPKTFGAGESPKCLFTKMELDKSSVTWGNLGSKTQAHIPPWWASARACEGKACWDMMLLLKAQATTKERTGDGLSFSWVLVHRVVPDFLFGPLNMK